MPTNPFVPSSNHNAVLLRSSSRNFAVTRPGRHSAEPFLWWGGRAKPEQVSCPVRAFVVPLETHLGGKTRVLAATGEEACSTEAHACEEGEGAGFGNGHSLQGEGGGEDVVATRQRVSTLKGGRAKGGTERQYLIGFIETKQRSVHVRQGEDARRGSRKGQGRTCAGSLVQDIQHVRAGRYVGARRVVALVQVAAKEGKKNLKTDSRSGQPAWLIQWRDLR